jgi:hypothetical protein
MATMKQDPKLHYLPRSENWPMTVRIRSPREPYTLSPKRQCTANYGNHSLQLAGRGNERLVQRREAPTNAGKRQ